MDIKQIRQLVQEHGTVVLVEEGQQPLVIRQAPSVKVREEEVPISARWPKAQPPERMRPAVTQDSVLERLNKEILALREQIAQEEAQVSEQSN